MSKRKNPLKKKDFLRCRICRRARDAVYVDIYGGRVCEECWDARYPPTARREKP